MVNQPQNQFQYKSIFVIGTLVAFVVGIFVGDFYQFGFWWLGGIFLGLIMALIFFWQTFPWRLSLFILIGLILGLGYYRFWDNRQRAVIMPQNQEITFIGQIIGHPDFLGAEARYVVTFREAKIQVNTTRFPEWHYGDQLEIKGTLKPANDYFFHQGISGVIYNPLKIEKIGAGGSASWRILTKITYQIRDKFEEMLNKILSEPYASFAAGLVLGSKRNIPDSLMADFNRTGTTHIVAVSGYNVTIVIVNLGLLLGLFSNKWRFWGTLVAILGFVVMTGAPASVVRAGLLAGLCAWGRHGGRRVNLTILLLLVAFLMLLFNPYVLRFDISFQLSFLSFFGLVYLAPMISTFRLMHRWPKFLKLTLSETMGAQIMVMPILVYYFGRASVISPLVNILILWLVPAAMLAVFAVGITGLIWFEIGRLVGYITLLLLKYIIVVIESFSKIPWASLEFKASEWWWMALFYGIIGWGVWKFKLGKIRDDFDEQF